jgi:hypothetical protein
MAMAGWLPADDDILPHASGTRRRGGAPKGHQTKAPKEPKVKAKRR